MKLPVALLIASLAVNAAVLTLYFKPSAGAPSAGSPAAAALAEKSAGPTASGASVPAAASDAAAQNAQRAKSWAELQTGDLNTLVARLKAAGFSTSMIRAIVFTQVNEQFAARRKELVGNQTEQPFWKNQRSGMMDPKIMTALRDLGKEQMALMKSLLGPEGTPGNDEMNAWQRRQFGNLAPEKLTQLQSINTDYSELQQEIMQKANGVMLPEDREKLAYLEKEKLADIAKTLTPQEFEEFQLRSSNTANQLRGQLGSFNTTEAEFRALYKAAAAIDEKYGTAGSFGGARNPGDYQNRQADMLAQAKAVLTPERFADYKLATDPQSRQVSSLVARLELPPATTQQVVSLQQDVQARARAIQTNRALSVADRTAQLTALQQEATAKLTTTLTPRGLEAYKQNGGYWLDSLKPRPAAPSGATTPAIPPGAMPAVRLPGG
jgi:hypothetical protein